MKYVAFTKRTNAEFKKSTKKWKSPALSGPSPYLENAATAARIAAIRRDHELWACSNSHIAGQSVHSWRALP